MIFAYIVYWYCVLIRMALHDYCCMTAACNVTNVTIYKYPCGLYCCFIYGTFLYGNSPSVLIDPQNWLHLIILFSSQSESLWQTDSQRTSLTINSSDHALNEVVPTMHCTGTIHAINLCYLFICCAHRPHTTTHSKYILPVMPIYTVIHDIYS